MSSYPAVLKLVVVAADGSSEVRRVRIQPTATYASVLAHVHRVLALAEGSTDTPRLTYVDDEGDTIRVASQEDLEAAVSFVAESGSKYLRLTVHGTPADRQVRRSTPTKPRTPAAGVDTSDVGEGGGVSPGAGSAADQPVEGQKVEEIEQAPVASDTPASAAVAEAAAATSPDAGVIAELPADVVEDCFVARPVGRCKPVTVHANGVVVQHTFRLRNEGATQWPSQCRLIHVGGDRMGAPAAGVPVCRAVPGETATVGVTFIPCGLSAGERRTSEWRLWAPSGDGGFKFGYRVWLDVNMAGQGEAGSGAPVLMSHC